MSAVAEVEATVRRCIEKKTERLDNPHRDKDVLCYFYHDSEMTMAEVGNELETSNSTVNRWLKKTDVGSRDRSAEHLQKFNEKRRVERATFGHGGSGHENWKVRGPDGPTTVAVHQLLAVADGADPEDVWAEDTHVHHRTGIPWLNIENGVEVLSPSEHRQTHEADEWTEEDGIPVMEAN